MLKKKWCHAVPSSIPFFQTTPSFPLRHGSDVVAKGVIAVSITETPRNAKLKVVTS
jgi:hypothetical protein